MMAGRQNTNPNGAGRMSLLPGGPATNNANINKRQSMSSASVARQSMAPTTASNRESTARRSTLGSALNGGGGKASTGGTGAAPRMSVKDPRPLSDKQYVQECSKKVHSFLTEHGYDKPIKLRDPSVREYASYLEFLFRFIDPKFAWKKDAHLDEEIPLMYKALDYPISIQKGSLKAISPHEWPKLLGALTWFVELLTLELETERVEQERALIDTENADLIFFEYLTGAYQIFMNGVDDTSVLDRELALKFDAKNAQIEEENATLERSMGVLSRDIRKLEEFAAKLPELKKKRVELVADIDKLKDFAARLEDHKSEVQRKLALHETDLAAKRKRLDQLLKEKATLQKQLDRQEASGIDFRKMVKDRSELDEVVASLRAQREMAVRMMSESEIQLGKQLEVVEAAVAQYTELAMRLRLLPHSHNTKAPDCTFDLQFKSHAMADEMIAVDLRGAIKPALKTLRTTTVAAVRTVGAESIQLREQFDRLCELLEQRGDEVAQIEGRVQEQERACAAKKEAQDAQQRQLRANAKAIRDENETLAKAMVAQLVESHKAEDLLRMEETRLKSQFAQASQQLNNDIVDVVDRLTSFKQHIQTQLRDLKDEAQRVHAEFVQEAQRLNMSRHVEGDD